MGRSCARRSKLATNCGAALAPAPYTYNSSLLGPAAPPPAPAAPPAPSTCAGQAHAARHGFSSAAAQGVALLCASVSLLLLGSQLARLASPAAAALLRILLLFLQLQALALDTRIAWPPALLRCFAWLRALIGTSAAAAAAPLAGCAAPHWPYALHLQLLFTAVITMFLLALAAHAAVRLRARSIVLRGGVVPLPAAAAPSCPGDVDPATAAKLARIHALWRRWNAAVATVCVALSFAFMYVLCVLSQAWDCVAAADGASVLRADAATRCNSAEHRRLLSIAAALFALLCVGAPLALALWLRRLQRAAQSTLQRPAWRGLGDPATRATWGVLFESVRLPALL
jgi:hypothetical protein